MSYRGLHRYSNYVKRHRFLKLSVLFICFVTFSTSVFFIRNLQFRLEAHTQTYRFKPLPKNFVSGLLQLYYKQRLKSSDAFFVPEICNHRLIFRLRLQNLVNTIDTKLHNMQNFTFECYLISQDNLYHRNDSLLTVHVSTSVSPKIMTFIHFYKNSIECGQPLRVVGASKQQLVIHTPLLVKYKAFYKFSYRRETEDETFLEWPAWPLSSECVHQYKNKIKRKFDNLTFYRTSCLTQTALQVLSSQQMFVTEREALSMWLDAQYTASDVSSVILKRRIHPFERALNNTVCSTEFQNWISAYHVWHSRIGRKIIGIDPTNDKQRDIILKHNVRFILYQTFGSGTSDRLTHLISTYLVAILTKRFLLFDDTWPDFHEIIRSSLDYQAEIITPWIFRLNEVNTNISFNDPRYFSVKSQIMRDERPCREYDYNHEYPERILLVKSHTGNVVHTLTSSKSVYSEFLDQKLHMKADNLFGCLYHSLLVPRLSMCIDVTTAMNESSQYMLQMLMFPKYPTIGIQIRVGDSYMNDNKQYLFDYEQSIDKYKSYFECAQNLSNGRISTLVYLMCDSLDLRLAALTKWPFSAEGNQKIQVIASSLPVRHISYAANKLSALRTAMFDTFLFSLCDLHIITNISSFGRIPAFASLQRRPIYSFDANDQPICSHGEGQVTHMRAGHQWSGVR